MSFELLRHVVQTDPTRVASKSYLNCHVKGMHSVMLVDCPGALVRMFIATPDHEMWKNTPGNSGEVMSLGYHAHRTELTLHLARGRMSNIIGQVPVGWYQINNTRQVSAYRYVSKIMDREGGGKFEKQDNISLLMEGHVNNMSPGDTAYMPADMLHTVYVPRGEAAAWFVYEGKEDKNYDSVTLSDEKDRKSVV